MMPLLRPLFRNQTLRKRNRRPAASVPYGRRLAFENLEPRAMLSATLLNTPTWLERGPAPIHNSTSVDLNGNGDGDFADVAVGAIQAIAVDPTNANHVFVGTVNGGIWETGNVNATNPVWGTTTDQLPSLAISAIAINPANTNHVYAGTGSLSSDNLEGGQPVGLYRSFDGGTTWTQLGFDTFHGLQIQSIVPTSLRTIFVAASPPESRGSGAGGGVYRSDDFGVSWVRLSGTSGTFLPNAPATDLVSFAVNSTTVGFYAAVPFSGIFRSTDGGARWQNITNNLSSSIASAFQIDLSISPVSGQPVYAGLLGSGGHLINVFRSARGTDGIDNNGNFLIDEPAEATWQAIAHTPPDIGIDNGTFHFAILADSTLNDVVYIGGSGELESGVSRLFRGNSSTQTWTPLSQPVASNTAPHPDVRDLVFSGSSILRADDGGIYRLVNPRGISILPPTVWQSAIGNLRNSEVISVALDDQNNDFTADDVILAGIFDNGIDQRSATGQWTEIFGGDGLIVQAFDAGTPTDYAATQFSVGSRIDNGFPPRVNGCSLNTFLTPQFDPTIPFKVAYQVHGETPIGSSRELERGCTNLSTVRTASHRLAAWIIRVRFRLPNRFQGSPDWCFRWRTGASPTLRLPMWVRILATSSSVARQAGPSSRRLSAAVIANEGSGSTHSPLDIVLDTNKPQLAYAVTNSGVYMTQNMFDWQPITDDLAGLTLPGSELNLRSIALVNDDTTSITDDVILVGGLGGVFRRKVAAPAGPKWSEYGQRLPNTLVSDIEYDAQQHTCSGHARPRRVDDFQRAQHDWIGISPPGQRNHRSGYDSNRSQCQ